ncbi:MAG: hypothetical protein ABSB82_03055 [Terriglobia bacterium]|jgi:hypothetical protein
MRLKLWVFVVLACAAAPAAARRPKLAGKVVDAAALSKVRTYCVDTSNLKEPVYPGDVPRPEQFDVRELVKRESGPKGLLSKLPWKLEADCSSPGVDAIMRFGFRVILGPSIQGQLLQDPVVVYPVPGEFRWRAEIQVTDKASTQVVYEAEGNPVDSSLNRTSEQNQDLDHVQVQRYHDLRQDAAYHALAALVSDVKTISKNP